MMAIIQALVFVGAVALIGYVLAATVIPALPRMAKLLAGELDPAFAPRERLVIEPRRVSARAASAPVRAIAGWREAA
jgi:hypothetical protein